MKTAFTGPLADDLARRPRDTDAPCCSSASSTRATSASATSTATLRAFGWRVDRRRRRPRPAPRSSASPRRSGPIVIGFSLIFQFYIRRYRDVIRRLRAAGVDAHITMGGHFPSLGPAATFELVPELDSVVQYEGELTLLDLADALSTGADWRAIPGIVHAGRRPAASASRPATSCATSTTCPGPTRDFEPEAVLGRRVMPLLASPRLRPHLLLLLDPHLLPHRPGQGRAHPRARRGRRGDALAARRARHHHLPLPGRRLPDLRPRLAPLGPRARRRDPRRRTSPARRIWKINCRADAVDAELLSEMQDAGLYLVYMGLESGDGQGLDTLDKEISVEQNLAAVATLKRLGLVFDFGFMMLDPRRAFAASATTSPSCAPSPATARRRRSSAACSPTTAPRSRTASRAEGRLRGDVCDPAYDFLDPRIDAFAAELDRTMKLSGWIHGHRALSPSLNWAWNEVAVLEGLFPASTACPSGAPTSPASPPPATPRCWKPSKPSPTRHEAGRRSTVRPDALAQQRHASRRRARRPPRPLHRPPPGDADRRDPRRPGPRRGLRPGANRLRPVELPRLRTPSRRAMTGA